MQTIGRRLSFANCCQRGGDHASIGAGSAGKATEAKQRQATVFAGCLPESLHASYFRIFVPLVPRDAMRRRLRATVRPLTSVSVGAPSSRKKT